MTVCAVKSCKNYTPKKDKDTNITFHRFPTDPVTSSRWTEIIRRTRNEFWWKPKVRTYICSAHFHEKDTYTTKVGRRRIRSGAVPTKDLLYITSKITADDKTDNTNENVNVPSDLGIKEEKILDQNLYEPDLLYITSKITADDKTDNTNENVNVPSDLGIKEEILDQNLYEPDLLYITSKITADDKTENTNENVNVPSDLGIKEEKILDQNLYEPDLLYITSKITADDKTENTNENVNVPSDLGIKEEEILDQNLYEPSTSVGQQTQFDKEPTKENQEGEPDIDSSDLESIFDTPKKAKLRKELRRKTTLQMKHVKKIKLLQQKNRRLKKRNAYLRQVICFLKKQRFIDH